MPFSPNPKCYEYDSILRCTINWNYNLGKDNFPPISEVCVKHLLKLKSVSPSLKHHLYVITSNWKPILNHE